MCYNTSRWRYNDLYVAGFGGWGGGNKKQNTKAKLFQKITPCQRRCQESFLVEIVSFLIERHSQLSKNRQWLLMYFISGDDLVPDWHWISRTCLSGTDLAYLKKKKSPLKTVRRQKLHTWFKQEKQVIPPGRRLRTYCSSQHFIYSKRMELHILKQLIS